VFSTLRHSLQVNGPDSLWSAISHCKSNSTNGANRPTQRPRGHNVWRCHWLSKPRAKTKQITSQTWAPLDVSGGRPFCGTPVLYSTAPKNAWGRPET